MVIYNVTIKVDSTIAEEWLLWLKNEHIPGVMATRCFTHATVLRLLETDDSEGPTFAVQYHALSKSMFDEYIALHADEMRTKGFHKWGNRFIAFRSVMEVMH
jgi:hypothetical protein